MLKIKLKKLKCRKLQRIQYHTIKKIWESCGVGDAEVTYSVTRKDPGPHRGPACSTHSPCPPTLHVSASPYQPGKASAGHPAERSPTLPLAPLSQGRPSVHPGTYLAGSVITLLVYPFFCLCLFSPKNVKSPKGRVWCCSLLYPKYLKQHLEPCNFLVNICWMDQRYKKLWNTVSIL